jgi:hypothetical protein
VQGVSSQFCGIRQERIYKFSQTHFFVDNESTDLPPESLVISVTKALLYIRIVSPLFSAHP